MKLSIIISIYRRPEEIDPFFERIYTQSDKNFELIVVVDTNSQGQLTEVQKWAKKFKNKIKIIYNTKRQGATKAHLDAIQLATGDYTLFICTADQIKRTDGIKEMLIALKEANNPDVLEFPASFRGVKKWNPKLKVKSTTAVEIEKKPMFIAKTMPIIMNKLFKTNLILSASTRFKFTEINSKFSNEWMYAFLMHDAKTFATVNKRLIKTFIAKYSATFNPVRISNQFSKIICHHEEVEKEYLQEIIYASLYANAIFLPIFTIAFKNKVMFDKLYKQITKVFEKELKNALTINKYLLKNNKEAIWLSSKKTKTELKKLVKDFE